MQNRLSKQSYQREFLGRNKGDDEIMTRIPVYVAYYNEGEGDCIAGYCYFYNVEDAKDKVDEEVQNSLDIIKYDIITEDILLREYSYYTVEKLKIE